MREIIRPNVVKNEDCNHNPDKVNISIDTSQQLSLMGFIHSCTRIDESKV